ncbi:GNAT family N-acetyltransferase [Sphingomonas sp. MMS24-J13]|uniref:GNAT family N-acetyltransferase n=1 Tax=Sphingomonas sp. MMS24-J13 TaxID=3238686 RepID=UPI00384C995B
MPEIKQAVRFTPQSKDIPETDLVSRSGVRIHVSQAQAGDIDALSAFFSQLGPDDLRFRFLGTMSEVPRDQIAAMLDNGAITFLARNATDGALIAVATLVEQHGGTEAEVALSTLSEWKHRGVSWTLLEHVLNYARAHGYRSVSSLEAAENRDAVKLEREMGFVTRLSSAEPVELICSKRLSE